LSKKHLALTLPLPLGKFFSFILQPFKARNKSFFVKKWKFCEMKNHPFQTLDFM
jgi:hypothetical protein